MKRYKITHDSISPVVVVAKDEMDAYYQLPHLLSEESLTKLEEDDVDDMELGFDSKITELESGSLIEEIIDEIVGDNEPFYKRENELLNIYYNASPNEKELIDYVFIAMCGWDLDTLIGGSAWH